MALLKTSQYSTDFLDISQLFKLLGHPGRLLIFTELCQNKVMTHRQIMEILKLSKSVVYEHVRKMKEIGILLETTIAGDQVLKLNDSYLDTMSEDITLNKPMLPVFSKLYVISKKHNISSFIENKLEDFKKLVTQKSLDENNKQHSSNKPGLSKSNSS